MRIAVFGGSFNPVHIGHLALAEDVCVSMALDSLILVPAFISPHKAASVESNGGIVGPEHRLAMLAAALEGNSRLQVDDCEIARGGVSFTIDTLRFLEEKWGYWPDLVIGEDLAEGLPSWKEGAEILGKSRIIIARRPDNRETPDPSGRNLPYPAVWLENPLLPISSTDIRSRISAGKSWRYLVPEGVYRYIEEHNLYGQ